jgi:hypothetical protein
MNPNIHSHKLQTIKACVKLLFIGDDKNINQDDMTRLTIAQVLETISADLNTLANADLMIRMTEVFYQTLVTENTEVNSNGLAIEIRDQALDSYFAFVDNTLNRIDILSLASQEDVKIKLNSGIEYALRGSLADEAPGGPPINRQGSAISISAAKISVNGFDTNTSTTFSDHRGKH